MLGGKKACVSKNETFELQFYDQSCRLNDFSSFQWNLKVNLCDVASFSELIILNFDGGKNLVSILN